MRKSLELQLQVSEKRQAMTDVTEKLNSHSREGTNPDEDLLTRCDELTREVRSLEVQYRSAVTEEDAETKEVENLHVDDLSSEERELRSLEDKAHFSDYLSAAMEMRSVTDGAALELNQALNIGLMKFPIMKLAPSIAELEQRQTTDVDTSTVPRSWVDRLFYQSAAARLGITFESVSAGVASYPVTVTGGTGGQRAKSQAASAAVWSISALEMKPTRATIHGVIAIEDVARVPSLEEAIVRDLRAALVAKIDKSIFSGDSGASGTDADITGLRTAAIGETELTQGNKVKGAKVLEVFVEWVDGLYAEGLSDLAVVASVGANAEWMTTVMNSAVDNQTVAQFLRASGMAWSVRGEIDSTTTNGKFGAFVSLGRGRQGAAVCPVWTMGEMVRDNFTGAAKGETHISLSTLWNFGLPRAANYKRLKFVS